jgi:HEAT repeat protein
MSLNPRILAQGATILGMIQDERALPKLEPLTHDERSEVRAAAQASVVAIREAHGW